MKNVKKILVNNKKAEAAAKKGAVTKNIGEDLSVLFVEQDGKPVIAATKKDWEAVVNSVDDMDDEPVIRPMFDLLTSFGFETGFEDEPDAPKMTVVTNKDMWFGSGLILRDDVKMRLEEIYGDSYIILPSSVHETIIMADIPENYGLSGLVAIVNDTCVSEDEVSSDHAYKCVKGEFFAIN